VFVLKAVLQSDYKIKHLSICLRVICFLVRRLRRPTRKQKKAHPTESDELSTIVDASFKAGLTYLFPTVTVGVELAPFPVILG
jgi:hypothetical protein